jgi:hypothetical protein
MAVLLGVSSSLKTQFKHSMKNASFTQFQDMSKTSCVVCVIVASEHQGYYVI